MLACVFLKNGGIATCFYGGGESINFIVPFRMFFVQFVVVALVLIKVSLLNKKDIRTNTLH